MIKKHYLVKIGVIFLVFIEIPKINSMEKPKEPALKRLKIQTYENNRDTWKKIQEHIKQNKPKKALNIFKNIEQEKLTENFDVDIEAAINRALDLNFVFVKFKTLEAAVIQYGKDINNHQWMLLIDAFLDKKVQPLCFEEMSILAAAIKSQNISLVKNFLNRGFHLASTEINRLEYQNPKNDPIFSPLSDAQLAELHIFIQNKQKETKGEGQAINNLLNIFNSLMHK